MNLLFKKKFIKDLTKLPVKQRKEIEEIVFCEIPKFKHFGEFRNIRKMTGYSDYYRTVQLLKKK